MSKTLQTVTDMMLGAAIALGVLALFAHTGRAQEVQEPAQAHHKALNVVCLPTTSLQQFTAETELPDYKGDTDYVLTPLFMSDDGHEYFKLEDKRKQNPSILGVMLPPDGKTSCILNISQPQT